MRCITATTVKKNSKRSFHATRLRSTGRSVEENLVLPPKLLKEVASEVGNPGFLRGGSDGVNDFSDGPFSIDHVKESLLDSVNRQEYVPERVATID